MSYLLKSLSPLRYDGDWHTRLMSALDLAEAEASSNELLISIRDFRAVLLRNDECLQQVVVTRPMPIGMDYHFACTHIRKACLNAASSFAQADPNQITLRITMRGSRSYVTNWANSTIEKGLRFAMITLGRNA